MGVVPLEGCDRSLHGCLYSCQVDHLSLFLWQGGPSSLLLGCNWKCATITILMRKQLKPRLPFLAYCLHGVCVHIGVFANGKGPSLYLVHQTSHVPWRHIFAISGILARVSGIPARVSSLWPGILAVDSPLLYPHKVTRRAKCQWSLKEETVCDSSLMAALECPVKAAEFDKKHSREGRKVKKHAGAKELANQYTTGITMLAMLLLNRHLI